MDLDEFLFYEKKKNKEFSNKVFAKKIGFSHTYLSNVMSGKYLPSAHILYEIDKYSNGQVDILKILREAYNNRKVK